MAWSSLDTKLECIKREGAIYQDGKEEWSSSFSLWLNGREKTFISLPETTDPNEVQVGWILQAVCYSAQVHDCFWELNSAGACHIRSKNIEAFQERTGKPVLALLAAYVDWVRKKKEFLGVEAPNVTS